MGSTGLDLSCPSCHDHLFYQKDIYGLEGFSKCVNHLEGKLVRLRMLLSVTVMLTRPHDRFLTQPFSGSERPSLTHALHERWALCFKLRFSRIQFVGSFFN